VQSQQLLTKEQMQEFSREPKLIFNPMRLLIDLQEQAWAIKQ